MQRPWLFVFDLDGTLIDSTRDLCASVNAALAEVGKGVLTEQQMAAYIGDGAATLMRRALRHDDKQMPPAEAERIFELCFPVFLEYYRVHKLDHTQTYPGVLESLAAIREQDPDLLMAVLTNKPVRPSREICAALGISDYMFVNYGGNSFATKKPSPEGLSQILAEAQDIATRRGRSGHSLSSKGAVMIGDSPADVRVGQACGTRTLGCSYGLAPEEMLLAEPDLVVASPYEWLPALGL